MQTSKQISVRLNLMIHVEFQPILYHILGHFPTRYLF